MKPVNPDEFNSASAREIGRKASATGEAAAKGDDPLVEIVRFLARVAAERDYGLFLASQGVGYDGSHQEAKS